MYYYGFIKLLDIAENTMNGTLKGLSSGKYEIQYDNGGWTLDIREGGI